MPMDLATLELLRSNHPAWRLLCEKQGAVIASFLHKAFVLGNTRVTPAEDLASTLDDALYELRQRDAEAWPRPASEYLDEWAKPDKGFLRKFYRTGSDEACFDLTPGAEKALAWLEGLAERSFVGTESRLMTVFELLRQISEGTESDPARRLNDLHRRRDEIQAEINRVVAGQIHVFDDTEIRDRFQQVVQTARELLGDFREVEANFRALDRRVRERIALWDGFKGALLDEIFGERDAISDSDQGRSFRAFWDFLMSHGRQDELSELLERVLSLPAVAGSQPDLRVRRVHHDWLTAAAHTQRTVALLSQQVRRFLDDRVWVENRRIMDLLHAIETQALAMRDTVPSEASFMPLEIAGGDITLPLERPLFDPAWRPKLAAGGVEAGDENLDADELYAQVSVDKARLARQLRAALQDVPAVTLAQIVDRHPLQQGLAELVAYLELDHDTFSIAVDSDECDTIRWVTASEHGEVERAATIQRVTYAR